MCVQDGDDSLIIVDHGTQQVVTSNRNSVIRRTPAKVDVDDVPDDLSKKDVTSSNTSRLSADSPSYVPSVPIPENIIALKSDKVKCEYCDMALDSSHHIELHKNAVHPEQMDKNGGSISKVTLYSCGLCDFHGTSQAILNDHTSTSHYNATNYTHSEATKNEYCLPCEICEYKADNVNNFLIHLKNTHSDRYYPSLFNCTSCAYSTNKQSDLDTHVKKEHSTINITQKPQLVFNCDYCEETAPDKQSLDNQIYETHPDYIMRHTMASQINQMSDKFTDLLCFKDECMNMIKTVLDNQNAIKQELFVLRNLKYDA